MHGHKTISEWPQGTKDFIRPHISVDLTHCSRREFGSTREGYYRVLQTPE